MEQIFKEKMIKDLNENVFKIIGTDWMLITAGDIKSFNTMTASWGGLGVLWNKNVCFIFVRPQRYTYEFLEKSDFFTLSFFTDDYKGALTFCGTYSGRNVNKELKTGLEPIEELPGRVFFKQARLVFECKKLYYQDIDPKNFIDKNINSLYSNDYHRMYIAEITRCLQKIDK